MFKQFGLKQKPMFMIIPMIDIIFFLLVFFMMNSLQTVAQKSLDVQLPVAQAAVQQKHVPVIITLDTDGKPLSLTDAKEVLVTKQEANPAVAVVLQADAHSAHGQVVAIMDLVRSAGIKKFSIGATNK